MTFLLYPASCNKQVYHKDFSQGAPTGGKTPTLPLLIVHFLLQVGGNRRAKEFLCSQSDYDHKAPLQQKYNTRAAALYRDKVLLFYLYMIFLYIIVYSLEYDELSGMQFYC